MDRTRWLALPLCALLLTACGSSSSGDKLSKSDLIAKADTICSDASKETKSLKPKNTGDINQLTDATTKAAKVVNDAADKLKGLTPPDSVKSDYSTFTTAISTQGDKATQLAAALKKKDKAKIQSIATSLQKDDTKGKAAAKRIGFKECAK